MSTPSINKSLVAFLAKGSTVRGIKAVYDEDAFKRGAEVPTFYKATDQDIEVGDIVTVPADTRLGFTTNKVVEVDVTPDFNWKHDIKWIVGAVKTQKYDECIAYEKQVMDGFQKAEQKRLQKEMEEQLSEVMGEVELPKFAALPAK